MKVFRILPLLFLALLLAPAVAAFAEMPIMLRFREVVPSPAQREALVSFAREMEGADAELFTRRIDFEAFEGRVSEKFPAKFPELRSESFAKAFFRGIRKSLGRNFFANVSEGAEWQFIRLREFEGRQYALYRVDQADGSLVYLDFAIAGNLGEEVRIVDWYDYAMSRWSSEGMATGAEFVVMVLKMGREEGKGRQKVISAFLKACQTRNMPEILSRYRQLPETLHRHSFARHAYRLAATSAGDESYRVALAEISREGYSVERSFALVDHYFLSGDYGSARRAVHDFSSLIGGDVALDSLLATLYREEGKYLESILACEKAIRKDPDYEDAYFNLLTTFGLSGSYADALLVLDLLERRFQYDFAREHFDEIEGLEGFASSRELAEWLARKANSPG